MEPDIITYSIIIKGFYLKGDADRAFSILDDMKGDDKLAPDAVSYTHLTLPTTPYV